MKMENGKWRMENLNFSSFLGAAKGDMTTPLEILTGVTGGQSRDE
jgi:hypothetical protein